MAGPPLGIPTAADRLATKRGLGRVAVLGLAVGGAVCGAAGCDSESTLRKVAAVGFFDPDEVDFGTRNVTLEYDFPVALRNTRAQPIRVQDVRFAPATDLFLLRRADGGGVRGTRLTPGQSLAVVVRYLPRDEGRHDATMTVAFDDFEFDVPIRASAVALEPARPSLSPTSVGFFDVPLNGEAVQVIDVTNIGQTDGALANIDVSPPFSVRAVGGAQLGLPTAPLAPDESLPVEIVYSPTSLTPATDFVAFEFDTFERTSLTVTGAAAPAGTLTCSPDPLAFGDVARGQIAVRTMTCQTDGGPYRLAQVRFASGSSDSFRLDEIPADVDASGRVDVDLLFASTTLPGPHRATVEFIADHGAVTTLEATASTVPPDPSATAISITMSWNTARTDFDLHFVRAPGVLFGLVDDCYWREKNPPWGQQGERLDDPFLDRDAVNGFGPESINLGQPAEPRYDVYVQYFNATGPSAPSTTVEVDLRLDGEAPIRRTQTMSQCGRTWHVGRIDVIGGDIRFTAVDSLSDANVANAKCE